MRPSRLLLGLALCTLAAHEAHAERIFYRSGMWLETSAPVQHLSLLGVLQAWERLARAPGPDPLPVRYRAFVGLHHCLAARGESTPALLDRVTLFSLRRPDRTYYSLTDFIAEALRELCPES